MSRATIIQGCEEMNQTSLFPRQKQQIAPGAVHQKNCLMD